MKKLLFVVIILAMTITGEYFATADDMNITVQATGSQPLILAGGGGSGGSKGGQKEKDCAAIAALAGVYCAGGYYYQPCINACKDVVDGGCCNTIVSGSINPCMNNDLPDKSNCLKH